MQCRSTPVEWGAPCHFAFLPVPAATLELLNGSRAHGYHQPILHCSNKVVFGRTRLENELSYCTVQ